jgi:hypothetical protein
MAKGRRGVEQDRGDTGEGLVVVWKGMIRKSYWAMARDRLGRERGAYYLAQNSKVVSSVLSTLTLCPSLCHSV